jgi:serine/threonine protein kinase
MGAVHLARRDGSADVCIIKRMRSDIVQDSVVAQRFLREAQISSLLVHPHIARLTDAWREDGNLYLAMEYVPGLDLESIMLRSFERGMTFPLELAVSVSIDVLAGLQHAHELRDSTGQPLGLVHRDVTPRNVMISFDGAVKVIDFGIARAPLGDFRTAPGMLVGTLRYMSPEQAVADPIDRRTDLYSWAVVLFEMLTARPFVNGGSMHEILRAIVFNTTPPLRSLRPDLPPALGQVLARALHKQKEERYATARELSDALLETTSGVQAVSQQLGWFVSQLFPEKRERTARLLAEARRPRTSDEPEFMPTRTAIAEPTSMQTVMVPAESFVPTADLVPGGTTEQGTELVLLPENAPRFDKRVGLALPMAALLLFAAGTVFWSIETAREEPEIIATSPREPEAPSITARQNEDRDDDREEVDLAPRASGSEDPPAPHAPIADDGSRRGASRDPASAARKAKAVAAVPPAAPVPARGPTWEQEARALISQNQLEDARVLMQRALTTHRLRPEAERSARSCLGTLEHKFAAGPFEHCVDLISAAIIPESTGGTP